MTGRRLLATATLFLAGACAIAAPGHTQSFLGRGPAERFAVPPSGDVDRAGDSSAPPGSSQPGPSPASTVGAPQGSGTPASLQTARLLPAGTRGFRLSGEEDAIGFPVFLTDAQTRGPARLRIAYLSAVSVAPEMSELSATVNGVRVGRIRVQAPGAVRVVELDLPQGLLRQGYNALVLGATQRHRVDCSVEATYELWTQIDPSRSGLIIPRASDLDLRTLSALEPDETGGLPVAILLGERPSTDRLQRMIGAAQAVALVARLARPNVTFGVPLVGRSGVNLLVGTVAELKNQEGLEAAGPVSGPKLALLPARPDRAPTLVVTGLDDADVAEAIRNLAETRDEDGTDLGQQALQLARGYRVQGGETVTFDKLGFASREFAGRQLHLVAEMRLPADFLPADYGKVMLHLAGGYVDGLSPGSRVIVDVNGRNAASIPLPSSRGELFNDNAIPMPLSLWRPGLNRLEVTVQVPTAADAACAPVPTDTAKARFLFLDRTRLDFPAFARTARGPDLASFKAGGLPLALARERPRLILPSLDRESLEAAASIVARVAIAAGRVQDFDIDTEARANLSAAQLVIGPARALPPDLLRRVGLDPEEMRRAWEGRADAVAASRPGEPDGVFTLDRLRRDVPARCVLPPLTPVSRPPAGRPGPTAQAGPSASPSTPPRVTADATGSPGDPDHQLVARWDENLRGRKTSSEYLTDVLGTALNRISTLRGWLGQFGDVVRDAAIPFRTRASLVVAQGPGVSDGAVILVSAPNPSLLRASASCLIDPVVWTRMLGQVAFLEGQDGTLTTIGPTAAPVSEIRDRNPQNLRLTIDAWLSLNPLLYAGLALASASLLGLATAGLVRRLGRTNP